MFNLEILWLIASCYHGGPRWPADGETARFAGISDLAAEKVIVQETGREAGGSARKVVCNALKMHREAEGGSWAWLEVSRQGGHLDIRQGFRVLIWTREHRDENAFWGTRRRGGSRKVRGQERGRGEKMRLGRDCQPRALPGPIPLLSPCEGVGFGMRSRLH